LIPARLDATRFPAKLMQILGDKTVIRHTYDSTVATGLFSEVFVVTDSPVIFTEINVSGGNAIMSRNSHESGTDRIADCWARNRGVTVIVFRPDWERHGKAAPFRRNDVLLDQLPVGVLAFPGTGITANLVDKARKMGVPVWRFDEIAIGA
jgi:hypothetical protein